MTAIRLGVGAAFVLIVALVGCNGTSVADAGAVVQPATIQVDGQQWRKVEWNDEIAAKVDNHFRRSPWLTDNPSLSGEAVCYVRGDAKRIYWVSAVGDTCHWAMVEFAGQRGGELQEGVGAPFVEVSANVE